MNLPQGLGLWPAFWMLPQPANDSCSGCGKYGPWSASGEIDIMESVNNMTNLLGTTHFGGSWPNNVFNTSMKGLQSYETNMSGYHTFAIEWTVTEIRYYLDGIQYGAIQSGAGLVQSGTSKWYSLVANAGPNAPFDETNPFYLIVNLAVGGNLPSIDYAQKNNGATLDLATVQQALLPDGKRLYIDFIRVCGK